MAFVPGAMPAELRLGTGTVRLLEDAVYALGLLNGSAGRLVSPYLIGQPLLRREAILSSRIEGTWRAPENERTGRPEGHNENRGNRQLGPPQPVSQRQ